ncbi:hypothetical protein BSKO_07183 [Bryopsis sp. KO-2023]|nr:hypothetical protein BSKO_07183 [Bryopsis sp. KO-2023]
MAPAWNARNLQYENAVGARRKAQLVENLRPVLCIFGLLGWGGLVRVVWWVFGVAISGWTFLSVFLCALLAVEGVMRWSTENADRQLKDILRGRPRRPQHHNQSLLGFGMRRRQINSLDGVVRPSSQSVEEYFSSPLKDTASAKYPEDTPDNVRPPRTARNSLFGPLTTPGRSDIEELTRGFDDSTNRGSRDQAPRACKVLNEYEAELFRGIKFNYDQRSYQASKPIKDAGFQRLGIEDLTPSSLADLADFLQWLGIDYGILKVWGERFRRWVAYTVVKQIDREISKAYEDLITIAKQMGERNINVFPLSQVISLAEEKKEDVWIRAKRESLQRELQQNPNDRAELKKSYLQALDNWDLLSSLLACSWGVGLLPGNTPRGYVGMRLKSMAVGTYMQSFQWRRPQQGHGNFYPEDLPSDSEIVFALVTAYLVAPGWNWGLMKERSPESSGGPLYVGELPRHPAKKFSALLTKAPRVSNTDAKAAILRTRTTSFGVDPVFTLMVGGKLAINLSDGRGVFHAISLFVYYHKLHHDEKIGGRSLDIMDDLRDVFEKVSTAQVPGRFGKRDRYHY